MSVAPRRCYSITGSQRLMPPQNRKQQIYDSQLMTSPLTNMPNGPSQ